MATTTSSQVRSRTGFNLEGTTVPSAIEALTSHNIKLPADLVKALIKANVKAFSSQDLWDCCVLSAFPSLNQTLEIIRRCQQLCVLEYLVFAPIEKIEYFPFENFLGKQGTIKILPINTLTETIRQTFTVNMDVKNGEVHLTLTPRTNSAIVTIPP